MKFNSYLYEPVFKMVPMKTGACLENDPDRNKSGFNLSAY